MGEKIGYPLLSKTWRDFTEVSAYADSMYYEKQKHITLKDELLRSVGTQYSTGEELRNSSRRNEEAESKQKQSPVVDGESKVWCYKKQ